jgi:L-histidine Nalpha-methyltransferase / hercynylcysteine S-oxide synthase
MMMALGSSGKAPIFDIRNDRSQNTLREDLLLQLKGVKGQPKRFPNEILYDETGLKIYEEITHLEEYYLQHDELEIFSKQADDMAQQMASGAQLVELGSGYASARLTMLPLISCAKLW